MHSSFRSLENCLLVWMFHSRKLNNRINSIHERALTILFRDYDLTFQQLLKQNKAVSILATEIVKTKNGLNPVIMENYLNLAQRRLIMNAFIFSEFGKLSAGMDVS